MLAPYFYFNYFDLYAFAAPRNTKCINPNIRKLVTTMILSIKEASDHFWERHTPLMPIASWCINHDQELALIYLNKVYIPLANTIDLKNLLGLNRIIPWEDTLYRYYKNGLQSGQVKFDKFSYNSIIPLGPSVIKMETYKYIFKEDGGFAI